MQNTKDLTPSEEKVLELFRDCGDEYMFDFFEKIHDYILFGPIIEYELKEVASDLYFVNELKKAFKK